jgi:nucleotide-binding universal stress UspA family protein
MSAIFVATDLSSAADDAICQAHERATESGAKLLACHVIPILQPSDPLFPVWNQQVVEELQALRERSVSELISRVTQLTGRTKKEFDVIIGEGNAATFIVRKAEEMDAQLLVLGSYGATGLMRILIGSVADKVIRFAHCQVLLARSHEKSGMILVATDFSDPSLPAVEAAAEEARRTGGRVTILHCIDTTWLSIGYPGFGFPGAPMNPVEMLIDLRKRIDEKLEAVLKSHKIRGDRIVAEGPPAAAIVGAAEKLNAELVIVGSIGRTGLPRLVLGSVAEQVARTAPCSVLIVRLHRDAGK